MTKKDVGFLFLALIVGAGIYWFGFLVGLNYRFSRTPPQIYQINGEQGEKLIEILRAAGPPPAFGESTHNE